MNDKAELIEKAISAVESGNGWAALEELWQAGYEEGEKAGYNEGYEDGYGSGSGY